MQLRDDPVDLRRGHGPRLMIFEPPRHGKSLEASQNFPTWFLGTFPDKRVVLASYEQGLALGWSRRGRDTLLEYGLDFFGVQVRTDTKAAAAWETTAGGGMTAVGVGSGLTGRGADLLIIDDPLKDAEQANSEVIRQKVWDWWLSTARTRLMPGGAVLLIMTRWHEDDLAGRLLANDPSRDKFGVPLPEGERREEVDGDEWDVICLPALAEPDHPLCGGVDPLGREAGQPLWPAQYPAATLEQTKRASGDLWFSAMYQQRPAPAEGGMFKRANFRYWTGEYHGGGRGVITLARDDGPFPLDLAQCLIFACADMAATEKETSDYSAVTTWAITPLGDLVLLDCQRERLEQPKQPAWIAANTVTKHNVRYIGIEAKTFGLTLIQTMAGRGWPVKRLEADGDKVARATTAAVRYETHKVYHPTYHPMLAEFESELLTFPNATHDDWVDTVAYAALEMRDGTAAAFTADSGTTLTGGLGGRDR